MKGSEQWAGGCRVAMVKGARQQRRWRPWRRMLESYSGGCQAASATAERRKRTGGKRG